MVLCLGSRLIFIPWEVKDELSWCCRYSGSHMHTHLIFQNHGGESDLEENIVWGIWIFIVIQDENWGRKFITLCDEEENRARTSLTCSESTYPEVGGGLEFLLGSEIQGSWCERVDLGIKSLVWVGSWCQVKGTSQFLSSLPHQEHKKSHQCSDDYMSPKNFLKRWAVMGRSLSFFVKLGWSWECLVGCYNNGENNFIIAENLSALSMK